MSGVVYPLASKFASEFVGMMLTIWMGESILANELLPGTKGHEMGLCAVSIGFGLAFGVNIAWFGAISAHLNPAMLFFLAILGKLQDGWVEFIVLSCANMLGAFCGAVLVYLQFQLHFSTVPLPQDLGPVEALVHGFPDALGTNAARIASAYGNESQLPEGTTLRKEVRNIIPQRRQKQLNKTEGELLLEKMEVRREGRTLRRHSAQVAGLLHTHDKGLDWKSSDVEEKKLCSSVPGVHSAQEVTFACPLDDTAICELNDVPKKPQQQTESDKVFQAALKADALSKLSIFATRPAKYSRPANFYQELTATAALVFGAEMFNLRREMDNRVEADGPFMQALFVSLFITLLILGLGGTTGLAVNPARDAGPRFAHMLLPISGKGSSEWDYGMVPLVAPFVGAALGAGIFRAMELLYETGKPV